MSTGYPKNPEEARRKAQQTRKGTLERMLNTVPKSIASDLLDLTVAYRYAGSLLKNARVRKYLIKHRSDELRALEELLNKTNESCLCSLPEVTQTTRGENKKGIRNDYRA